MYNRTRVYPYKMGSKGAAELCEGLRSERIRSLKVYGDRQYSPRRGDFLINWGNSIEPRWGDRHTPILNHWNNVRNASNKLWAFDILSRNGVSVPEFTNDWTTAANWRRDGFSVLERSILSGHSGNGIIIKGPVQSEDIVQMDINCPLFVKYIKKEREYRIHVFNGEVIHTQMKLKKRSVPNEEVNYQIRSHNNGWIFAQEGFSTPDCVPTEAINAVSALNLTFGAVDVIYNRHHDRAYVLEVNTAPGLEGSTINKYVNSIKRLFRDV